MSNGQRAALVEVLARAFSMGDIEYGDISIDEYREWYLSPRKMAAAFLEELDSIPEAKEALRAWLAEEAVA